MSTKTIKQWLSELPDGYRERAQANLNPKWADDESESIHGGIEGGFNWLEAPEGHSFWARVCTHYLYGTPLPPLPDAPDSKEEFVESVRYDPEQVYASRKQLQQEAVALSGRMQPFHTLTRDQFLLVYRALVVAKSYLTDSDGEDRDLVKSAIKVLESP